MGNPALGNARRRWICARATIIVWLLVTNLVAPAAAEDTPVEDPPVDNTDEPLELDCETTVPVVRTTPTDADFYNEMVRHRTDNWVGGDATNHVDLGDGRILWLFGDTDWGSRRPDGSYRPGNVMATNSVMVQDGECVRALEPFAHFIDPAGRGDLYWPQDGWVADDEVHIVVARIRLTGDSVLSFRSLGRDLVSLDLATLEVVDRRSLPDPTRDWGSSVERDGDTIYWWGRSFVTATGNFFLARSTIDNPLHFQYRTAGGWSPVPSTAVAVHRRSRVSNASFHRLPDGRWTAVFKDDEFEGTGIVADVAANPWGPFAHMGRIATAAPRTDGAGEITYSASIHPALGWELGQFMTHWSHNSLEMGRVRDGTVDYLPTFATVPVEELADPAAVAELEALHRFVHAVHEDFLGRPPGELDDHWTNELSFGLERGVLVDRLARSDEWINREIDKLYVGALGRRADRDGAAYWRRYVRAGGRITDLGALVYGSPEFRQRAGGTDRGVIDSLYRRILGRAPDAEGMAYWSKSMAAGVTDLDVSSAFFASIESRTTRVRSLYRTLLGRSPEPGGSVYWADQLRFIDDIALAAFLARSPEYLARSKARQPRHD